VADRSISSSRAGTSPIGMCRASAAWPRFHSSFSRTSSNTEPGPNSAGRSVMVVCAIDGSASTVLILARADGRAKTGVQLPTGIHSFHRFIHRPPRRADTHAGASHGRGGRAVVDNACPLPLRDRQPDPAFSEFLAKLTVPPYSPLWRKSQRVCARRCQPSESGARLFDTRETPSPATRRWSARHGWLNFPGGT
jgi:hypothetical protein